MSVLVAEANAARAAAIVHTLVSNGVEHLVLSPGSRSTPLALAAVHSSLDVHVVLDERAAGFIGLGLARASGRPVALVCTSGSAGAHYLPSLIEANLGRAALIAITANRPSRLQAVGAPQTMDQHGLFGAHVRGAWVIGADSPTGHARSLAARALVAATAGGGGPVHLDVAFEEPLWHPDVAPPEPAPSTVTRARAAAIDAPRSLMDAIKGAARGVFVVGPHFPEHACEPLVRLAEQLHWPIVADGASGVRFGASSRAIVTTAEALFRSPSVEEALAPDLIIRLGHPPTTRTVLEWLDRRGRGRTWLVHADGELLDPSGGAVGIIVGDEAAVLGALSPVLPGRVHNGWLSTWHRTEAAARAQIDAEAEVGFWEGAIVHEVVNHLPSGSALCVASSMPIRDLDLAARVRPAPLTVFASRGVNGIDGTIATAAGVALANPHRPTLVLLGDLAMRHDIGGLMAAAELGAPVVLVVIDNGGGGIFEFLPISQHAAFTRLFLTPQSTDVAQLAAGVGVRTTVVDTRSHFVSALTDAVAPSAAGRSRGPEVIVAKVDRAANVKAYRRALASAAEAATEALAAPDSAGSGR